MYTYLHTLQRLAYLDVDVPHEVISEVITDVHLLNGTIAVFTLNEHILKDKNIDRHGYTTLLQSMCTEFSPVHTCTVYHLWDIAFGSSPCSALLLGDWGGAMALLRTPASLKYVCMCF